MVCDAKTNGRYAALLHIPAMAFQRVVDSMAPKSASLQFCNAYRPDEMALQTIT